MGVRLVNPETLTRPVGYSHAAIGDGRAVVLAGQIGCDQSGKVEAPDALVPQFAKALDNLLPDFAADIDAAARILRELAEGKIS